MKRRVRISEIIAVIISIVLIVFMSFIPQIFTDITLNRMSKDIAYVIENYDNHDKCLASFEEIESLVKKHEWLFCLVYSHVDVSDLQFAIESASVYLYNDSPDRERFLTELYRVRSCINTLIETEQPTLQHLM